MSGVRLGLAAALLGLAGWVLAQYPLSPWPLGGALIAYAAALWRWPSAFLLGLPVVLPAFDLGLWTGWLMLGESDLFVLVTLAVMLVRAPPAPTDLPPRGVGGWAVLALAASWSLAAIVGLLSPLGAEPSDNAFLSPNNALRLAKGLAEALVLLPFLISRQRTHGDILPRLGQGMAAGLAVVTAIVVAERGLYASLLDTGDAYRVAGPFSSMRVGGGHIGAYTAMALPFALAGLSSRGRLPGAVLMAVTLLAGFYTLAVTFARTAYAAAVAGLLTAALASVGGRRAHGTARLGIAAVLLVIAGLGAVTAYTAMRVRFAEAAGDFSTREGNWQAGLAVRDAGVLPALSGMGLGTYQRAMLQRSPVNRPSDLRLLRADGANGLELRTESPFYLGQKVRLPAGSVRLRLQASALDRPNTVAVSLCDKVLLYSDNCRGGAIRLPAVGRWETLDLALPTAGLGGAAAGGWLHRMVELSVFAQPGRIELRGLTLTGEAGQELLADRDFTQGLDRWLFTDDSHVSWRMLNVYLMLFFETGLLGLAAYLALAGLALAGALAAARSGITGAAPVAGAVAAFLVSGLFDDVVEAPRIATLFFLICLCGVTARRGAVGLTPADG